MREITWWKRGGDDARLGWVAPLFIVYYNHLIGKWILQVRYKFKEVHTEIELDTLKDCKTRAKEYLEVVEK